MILLLVILFVLKQHYISKPSKVIVWISNEQIFTQVNEVRFGK